MVVSSERYGGGCGAWLLAEAEAYMESLAGKESGFCGESFCGELEEWLERMARDRYMI